MDSTVCSVRRDPRTVVYGRKVYDIFYGQFAFLNLAFILSVMTHVPLLYLTISFSHAGNLHGEEGCFVQTIRCTVEGKCIDNAIMCSKGL